MSKKIQQQPQPPKEKQQEKAFIFPEILMIFLILVVLVFSAAHLNNSIHKKGLSYIFNRFSSLVIKAEEIKKDRELTKKAINQLSKNYIHDENFQVSVNNEGKLELNGQVDFDVYDMIAKVYDYEPNNYIAEFKFTSNCQEKKLSKCDIKITQK